MQFNVGDKVMHPRLGAGRVVGVEHKEWVEGYEDYYVVHIPAKDIIVRLPTEKADDLGIRRVMDEAVVTDVLKVLASKPRRLPEDAGKRYKRLQAKVETARPLQLAEAVRDLNLHGHLARLGSRDTKMLERARSFLASEMAVATAGDLAEMEQAIDEMVGVSLSRVLPEEQAAGEAVAG